MNNTIARAQARTTLSPRYRAANPPATIGQIALAAKIPANELRRLVATMVD